MPRNQIIVREDTFRLIISSENHQYTYTYYVKTEVYLENKNSTMFYWKTKNATSKEKSENLVIQRIKTLTYKASKE